jgi:hypothetical protein
LQVFLIPLLCSILLALGSLFYALFRLNAGTAVRRRAASARARVLCGGSSGTCNDARRRTRR